jgi:hypothetical protein
MRVGAALVLVGVVAGCGGEAAVSEHSEELVQGAEEGSSDADVVTTPTADPALFCAQLLHKKICNDKGCTWLPRLVKIPGRANATIAPKNGNEGACFPDLKLSVTARRKIK